MKTKLFGLLAISCWLFAAGSIQAKNYTYRTVEGDLTKTRIYTLDNGLKVYLCDGHHEHSSEAVHQNKRMDLLLKEDAERVFIKKYSYEKWMEVFGKNYLEEI